MSYQHIDPGLVGNEKRILISELSGRQNIMGKIKELGGYDSLMTDEVVSERAVAILNRVKHLESIGYTFEGAEASVDVMILHERQKLIHRVIGANSDYVPYDYCLSALDASSHFHLFLRATIPMENTESSFPC